MKCFSSNARKIDGVISFFGRLFYVGYSIVHNLHSLHLSVFLFLIFFMF